MTGVGVDSFLRKLVYGALVENIGSATAGKEVNLTLDPLTEPEAFWPHFPRTTLTAVEVSGDAKGLNLVAFSFFFMILS